MRQEKPLMEDKAEFRRQIRDALVHLYDSSYLADHPLAGTLVGTSAPGQIARAQALRRLLKEAVEALRPPQGTSVSTPDWRSYQALRHYYIEGTSFLETQQELGLSRRQLQRELYRGLNALADLLWQKRQPVQERTLPSGDALTADLEPLRRELEDWALKREACTLHALLRQTEELLQPMLQRANAQLCLKGPLDVPVLVDPVLMRQALAKTLRSLLSKSDRGRIVASGSHTGETFTLALERPGEDVDPLDPNWQAAVLLLERQGASIELGRADTGEVRAVLTLPLATRARVLVVDDTEAIHQLFARYLTPHNYEVVGTRTGAEALQLAAELQPDLITLDVMMPSFDGWQVLRDLRSDPRTASIPVIVCSVLDEPELALGLGACAFIKKPVNRLELLAVLEKARAAPDRGEAGRRGLPAGS